MDLRCQLRFAGVPNGARAILEAGLPDRSVLITVEATGPDEGQALSALAERTRALYDGVCGLVETVEELTRTYYETREGDASEDG